MLKEVANHLNDIFSTDQPHHVEQQKDGSYRKRYGRATAQKIESILKNEESIAIYQKNTDLSIRWVCFDFDIIKSHLESSTRKIAESHLNEVCVKYCKYLNSIDIPYLIEYSGNRGLHIWITFSENIDYMAGFEIQQEIIEKSNIKHNEELISIDRFPPSKSPSDGVGRGVKLPLSKHKKSNIYSYLLSNSDEIQSIEKTETLSSELLKNTIVILGNHKSISQSEVEQSLDIFLSTDIEDPNEKNRVRRIKVEKTGFNIDEILSHWSTAPPLKVLSKKINNYENLTHLERTLIVGIFGNVYTKYDNNFSRKILHEIFSRTTNYNREITEKALARLEHFNFPTQHQIEGTLGIKFDSTLELESLIKTCIPKYVKHEDATFYFSSKDIEICRAAESTYVFINDEVQSRIVIDDLSSKSSHEFLNDLEKFIEKPESSRFYKHSRNEGDKKRELVTLDASTRIATTCILKQISYFINLDQNVNSHGYVINKGFTKGYIFKPWLYLWIKFIANINNAIENRDHKDYYIIKTDIEKFYDSVPHDNLMRLLFGDGYTPVSSKLEFLPTNSLERYKKCITSLFKLSEVITKSRKGLPQGPAYSRYLAELYLAKIDDSFTEKSNGSDVVLYQRYVDDIFIIAKSKSDAEQIFSDLSSMLEDLSLSLNKDKTVITRIANFHSDFDRYRSQSKYSVDLVSKNFDVSSDSQKDSAIDEFMSIVQSDTYQDDLSFIFSHLQGVQELNDIKMRQVKPALERGVGRGSLFKNLFNFVFQLHEGWEIIFEIATFTELQSEVLTSCLINAIELNSEKRSILLGIPSKIVPKLTRTKVVSEHLSYLTLRFGCTLDVTSINPQHFITSLQSIDTSITSYINPLIFDLISTEINDIKSLKSFIKVIFACSFTNTIDAYQTKVMSGVFYAKMQVERENNTFNSTGVREELDPSTAVKLYYLLCLYSTSNVNQSTELLADIWRFCVHYLSDRALTSKHNVPNWLEKLQYLEIDNKKVDWIISSIVDGNIFRGGPEDKHHLFEKYHNALLVYLSFGNTNTDDEAKIRNSLEKLKEESNFYDWIISNTGVKIFPENNKKWFELNIIENGTIALKKGNSLLIRKQNDLYQSQEGIIDSRQGYAELITDHTASTLESIDVRIRSNSTLENISTLMEYVKEFENKKVLPAIFCPSPVLTKESRNIFHSEFSYSQRIISTTSSGETISTESSIKGLVNSYLEKASKSDKILEILLERYIKNLDNDIDLKRFISNVYSQLSEVHDKVGEFHLDISVASALYITLSNDDFLTTIKNFVIQYSKFHNNNRDKHIFGVNDKIELSTDNPEFLLDGISKSLGLIQDEYLPSLVFYLRNDIKKYKLEIEKLVSDIPEENIKLVNFESCYIQIQHTSNSVKVNNKRYISENVRIINPVMKETIQFNHSHTTFIRSSTHTYYSIIKDCIYILPVNLHISSIFDALEDRKKTLIEEEKIPQSYPIVNSKKDTTRNISGYSCAVEVISNHRGIDSEEADNLLINWLTSLPSKFHEPMIILIAAHESIPPHEIDEFINKVVELNNNKKEILLAKEPSDQNGTHRVLSKNSTLARQFSIFNPLEVAKKSPETVFFVSDVLISGSQTIKALKHYLDVIEDKASNFFFYDHHELQLIKDGFKNISNFNICCILYTDYAIQSIQDSLSDILNKEITVNVSHGRNVSLNSCFETSQKLSQNDRNMLIEFLTSRENIDNLNTYISKRSMINNQLVEINATNLITRLQSLPKRSFDFLSIPLRSQALHPFNKVPELNDM